MKKLIIALLTITMLSGCASIKQAICGPTILGPDSNIKINPTVLQSCKDLKELPEDSVDFFSVLEINAANVAIYKECRLKQETSITVLKQIGNIK